MTNSFQKYFITGIGTAVGKTIVSAILTEKLHADYWKPIQSGDLEYSDSIKVKNLLTNSISKIHPETYRLQQALSPHLSAKLDQIELLKGNILIPNVSNHLIIEGAGGIYVPLNQNHTILDLMKQMDIEIILVCKNYLGSINHTLLSIAALKAAKLKIKGLIFSGIENKDSETYIQQYSNLTILGHIPLLKEINAKTILTCINKIKL